MNHSVVPSQSTASSSQPAMRLRGGRLMVARVAWLIVAALTMIVFIASLPGGFAAFQRICDAAICARDDLTPDRVREIEALGLSVRFFAAAFLGAEIVFATIWFTVGAVIFWRTSDDRAALF